MEKAGGALETPCPLCWQVGKQGNTVLVQGSSLPTSPSSDLTSSCVWRVPWDSSALVPLAANRGFCPSPQRRGGREGFQRVFALVE